MNKNRANISLGDIVRIVVYILMLIPFIKKEYYSFLENNNVFFIVVASVLLFFSEKKYTIDKENIKFMSAITLISIISLFLKNAGIGNLIFFYWMFILPIVYRNILYNKNIFKIYILINFLFLLLILEECFQQDLIDAVKIDENSINPNILGLIGGAIGLLNMIFINYVLDCKILIFANSLISAVIVFISGSRTSLFSFFGCLILKFMLDKKIINKSNINLYLSGIFIGTNAMCYALYKIIYEKSYNLMPFLGKELTTGRELIWKILYRKFVDGMPYSLFIGVNDINSKSISLNNNCHNSYFEILTRFGVFVLLMCLAFLTFIINRYYNNNEDNNLIMQNDTMAVIFYYLLTSAFESSLFTLTLIFPFGIAFGIFIGLYTKQQTESLYPIHRK